MADDNVMIAKEELTRKEMSLKERLYRDPKQPDRKSKKIFASPYYLGKVHDLNRNEVKNPSEFSSSKNVQNNFGAQKGSKLHQDPKAAAVY